MSPTATPNRRLVALADRRLGREGRMAAAIAAIGRGADCFEGAPFALELAGPHRRRKLLPGLCRRLSKSA
jgi:hypothetical protein